MTLTVKAQIERWPIAGSFTISRGSKTEAVVVVVEVSDGTHWGRGEAVPYPRYEETPETALAAIQSWTGVPETLCEIPLKSARNAIDCALWDLKAKQHGLSAHLLAGIEKLKPLTVSYTLSLDTPEKMADAARTHAARPLLKIKLGREGDPERLRQIRNAAPKTRLIADANEGWTPENLAENISACASAGVELVEQPLPASNDAALALVSRLIPICADESVFDRDSLSGLKGKYDFINVKLDKTGGLTEALALASAAKQSGFGLMVGCMVCTSLSIAPAFLVAQEAKFADLDGALLLACDRPNALAYADGVLYPPTAALWG
ncbi:MAG: dipeptide epimerase [Alphaproteobacteria bacterium]|nr:dipeptide epimerase [Alphaproteobacteria bacterium]